MKYLIIGLGNPGAEYANTRHNIGYIILDALATGLKSEFTTGRYASVAKAKYRGHQLLLLKPSAFMNNSGKAVRYWLNHEKLAIENMLIVVDDIALPLGTLRVRKKGGDGGHNGLISVIEHIETIEFPRLRVGIGDDYASGYQVDYVLGKWTKKEEEVMIPKVKLAVEIIQSYVFTGVDTTMNRYNRRK